MILDDEKSEQPRDYEKIPTLTTLENYEYMPHLKRRRLEQEITDSLEGDQKRLYILCNFLAIGIDRLVDYKIKPPEFVLSLKTLMEEAWKGEFGETIDPYKKIALEFTQILRHLRDKNKIKQADNIFNDWLIALGYQCRDVQRRGKILSKDQLREVRKNAIVAGAAVYFQITSFALTKKEAWELAERYGLAAIEADDLVDIVEDLKIGFINVPQEDISHLDRDHLRLDKEYALTRLQELKGMFKKGDQILEDILPRMSESDRIRLNLQRDVWYTWIEDVENMYSEPPIPV